MKRHILINRALAFTAIRRMDMTTADWEGKIAQLSDDEVQDYRDAAKRLLVTITHWPGPGFRVVNPESIWTCQFPTTFARN